MLEVKADREVARILITGEGLRRLNDVDVGDIEERCALLDGSGLGRDIRPPYVSMRN